MRFTLVLLAAACVVPVEAQNQPIPPVLSIIRESVKEGRGAAHEKVEADWARLFRKTKSAPHSLGLVSVTGLSEAWFLTPFESFAAFEAWENEFQKQPFKNENDLLEARDGELRANSRSLIAIYRKDLSYRPDTVNVGKTRYVAIGSYRVRLGHEDELASGAKVLFAARDKTTFNRPTLCYQVIAGLPEGLFLFLDPIESLQEWDNMPAQQKAMMEAMGKETFQKFMQGAGALFASMETNLFSVNPRMSYVSKETEDSDPAFWKPKPASAPAKPAAGDGGQKSN